MSEKNGETPASDTKPADNEGRGVPEESGTAAAVAAVDGPTGEVRDLPLELIEAKRDLQARVKMDKAWVEELREVIRAKKQRKGGPPVVFHYQVQVPDEKHKPKEGEEQRLVTQDHYLLADGFHWFEAHKEEGKKRMEVEVREGNRVAALAYAIQANATHGLKRSTQDKERAVLLCLNEPKLRNVSTKTLAKRCQVSEGLAARVRAEWEKLNPEGSEKRVGADGKVRKSKQKKRKSSGPVIDKEVAEAAKLLSDPKGLEKRTVVPQPGKVKMKGLVDYVGRPVPESLGHVFKGNVTFDAMLMALRNQKALFAQLRASGAAHYAPRSIEANLDAIIQDLEWSKPAVVCRHCDGAGCKECKVGDIAVGFLSAGEYTKLPKAEKEEYVKAAAEENGDEEGGEEALELAESAS